MKIAVFGSINIDLTTYSKRFPLPGETVHGDRYAIGLGGKGSNQAVAASRLGAPTELIGRIGQDDFGETALAALRESGVSTDGVLVVPGANTGIAVISVDAQAQNSITVVGGANMTIEGSDVERARAQLESTDILLIQLETPLKDSLAAADIVRAGGGIVILDPAPAPLARFGPDILSRIDVITPNETETESLTGVRPANPKQAAVAAAYLRAKGVASAVIKLGANGVYYENAGGGGFVPPFKVDSIDTVAAGDCFNGGLAVALSNGKSLGDAVRFASACGALSTTRAGAASSAPALPDILDLLERQ